MTTTTYDLPGTFEGYLERLGLTADYKHVDELRGTYARERLHRELEPAVVPACPSWCADKPGHGYDSVDCDEATVEATRDITFMRCHVSAMTGPAGAVMQAEHNRAGVVTLFPAGIEVWETEFVGGLSADEARARAAQVSAEMQALAELLDSIQAVPGHGA